MEQKLYLKGILPAEEETIRRCFNNYLEQLLVNPFLDEGFAQMTVGEVLETSEIDPMDFWLDTGFNLDLIGVLSEATFRFTEDDCPNCGHEMERTYSKGDISEENCEELTCECPHCKYWDE